MKPELSRVVQVERLPPGLTVEATEAECAALAARLRIPAVEAVTCVFALRRRSGAVVAEGALDARVVQSCVVSLEPVEQAVSERFTLHFVPRGREQGDDDPDSPDEAPYDNGRIDLGEAAAEQLALALDPYPRRPGAALDPVATAEGDEPPSGLASLRRLQ